ncbi:ferric reductase like transmembrane component-domain-containing protein [Aspergillus coremiiformis]|uniref:Ferric reductase like transmembrane component-domain-containing protein n=1 Tax=Aspergillus coremiiformis TaxID=138285 RepID=A0A5N6Z4B5_9EURO|nr:ferric reductase like transmembrane component-domain-containing protein [Aspergillus coremiiformis]
MPGHISRVATCNFALLVFLALRNTPLAPLSGRSYEQLRPLHKTAGYTCIVTSTVHAIVYCKAWSNKLHEMLITANVAGIVGGLAMLVLGLSTISRFVRKSYEVFYAIHIVLFLLITVMVGMHRPVLAKKALIIVIWTGGIWFLDRLLRLSKFFRYFLGNYATITALPEDAIRVTLKAGVSSTPGSHAFLWVPSVRLMETHPFTFVRTDPAEFLIRVHDGFTRDLYLAAQKEPGRMIKCSVDGGYGQIPNFNRFDTIVLIAGGSGASFTFPIALGVIQAAAVAHTAKTIDFIWAKELDQLRENPRVNVYIYVTRDSGPSTLVEKSPAVYPSSDPSNTGSDLEKASSINSAPQPLTTTPVVRNERPDIARHLADRIALCASEQQVGVGVCGPSSMVSQTRESLSQGNGGTYGPSITLHTEEFEW